MREREEEKKYSNKKGGSERCQKKGSSRGGNKGIESESGHERD